MFLNVTVACQFLASHYPLIYHNKLTSNFQFWLPLFILYKPIAVWWQQCNHKKRNLFHMLEDPPVHPQERSCLSGRPRLGQSSRRSRTQVSVSEARGLDRQELDGNMIEGEVAYPSQGLWAGDKCSSEEEETRKKWNQAGPVDGGHLHKLYVSDGCHAANTSLICFLQVTLKFDLPVTVSILYNSNPHKVCHPWIIFNLKLLDLRIESECEYVVQIRKRLRR